MPLPRKALSVRQPYTIAIAKGWKGLENRNWRSDNPDLSFRGAICLHAGTGLTRDEYEAGQDHINSLGFTCPPVLELRRAGIIGTARVIGMARRASDAIVPAAHARWFTGPIAIVLADMQEVEFIPAAGALGFFEWKPADASYEPDPAKWMFPPAPPREPDLFETPAPRGRDFFGEG